MDACLRTPPVFSHSKPSFHQGHPTVYFGVYLCTEVPNQLRNSDLLVNEVYSFLRQIVSWRFRDTGKLVPFVFEDGKYSIFEQQTTAAKLGVKILFSFRFLGQGISRNRSICVIIRKYDFKRAENHLGPVVQSPIKLILD